jgi:thymidylate synthase (FAD)
MAGFATPQTFLIGYTGFDMKGLSDYLDATGNADFIRSLSEAKDQGLSDAEIMCSFYAKLCYRSLVLNGQNLNVTRIRDVPDNIKNAFDMGHGSVFEHAWLNFVTTNCSRVFTHELVRHRVGSAFSQTSGRYVRLDKINVVWDPILEGCEDLAEDVLKNIECTVYLMECRKGLRVPPPEFPNADMWDCLVGGDETNKLKWVPNDKLPFSTKKKLTSAIRRFAPNGQTNEIGWSVNLRSVRHMIQMRTAPGAEWEIRLVFNQVYEILREKFPLLFHGATEGEYDGLKVISGMILQPYEVLSHT